MHVNARPPFYPIRTEDANPSPSYTTPSCICRRLKPVHIPKMTGQCIVIQCTYTQVSCASLHTGVKTETRDTDTSSGSSSGFTFVHQPLGKIVETFPFRIGAISKHIIVPSFRTFEPLLTCVQVCFYSTAGEKPALHFLKVWGVSQRRRGGRAAVEWKAHDDACFRADWIAELDRHDTLLLLLHERTNTTVSNQPGWLEQKPELTYIVQHNVRDIP